MSRAATIDRADAANRQARLAGWRAAVAAGMRLSIVEDDELVMAASHDVPGRAYNRALGLARRPDLIERAIRFFGASSIQGWMELDEAGAALAVIDGPMNAAADRSGLFAGDPGEVSAGPEVPGVVVREVFANEVERWVEAAIAADSPGPARDAWLRRIAPHLLGTPAQAHRRLFAADAGGELVGVGALHSHDGVGWLTAGAVRRDFRNRGIQRALIGARAASALEEGCDLVASDALLGEGSDRNLARAGLLQIATRLVVAVPLAEELRPPG